MIISFFIILFISINDENNNNEERISDTEMQNTELIEPSNTRKIKRHIRTNLLFILDTITSTQFDYDQVGD